MSTNGHRNKLTQKQDRFARFLFDGLSQREAWIKAGYSHKYAIAQVDSHASVLANSDKVKQRYEELKAAADTDSIMNYQERQKVLTAIGRQRAFPKVQKSIISSIDTLNKMDKIYSDNPVVNVDNRSLTINVVSPEGKTLLEEVIEGSGTEKEPDVHST